MTRGRDGFTIIEVLIAVMLLTVGASALVGTSALVTRRVGRSRMLTVATEVGNLRLETLRSAAAIRVTSGGPLCASPSFASSAAPDTVQGVIESWTVTGTGNARTVIQTLTYRTPRGPSSFTLVTVIGCYK